mgnify:CR=1 FL=1|tara:strand:- start:1287 stop:1478 length:192 start_codon:yes stop_codon:yes gene_type:complete
MISGVYKLTVTCSVCGEGLKAEVVFNGKSSAHALDKCLNAGWKIDMLANTQTCPQCVSKAKGK